MVDYETIQDKVKEIWDKIPHELKYWGTAIAFAGALAYATYNFVTYESSLSKISKPTTTIETTTTPTQTQTPITPTKPKKTSVKKTPVSPRTPVAPAKPKIKINVRGDNCDCKYKESPNKLDVDCACAQTQYSPQTPSPTIAPTPIATQPIPITTQERKATEERKIPSQPSTPITPRPAPSTPRTTQQQTQGRTDGYNLTAKFFPKGYIGGPDSPASSENLDIITEDGDSGIANLFSIKPGQYIIIRPNNFDKEFFLKNIEIDYNFANAKDYFSISSDNKHIFITPKVKYFSGFDTGILKIKIPVKNKYGTVENETLEIILGNQ